jgi:aspartate/glutamate racemase
MIYNFQMKQKPLCFGIISGAGPMAGALIYSNIITLCQEKGSFKDRDFPEMIIKNIPFSPMIELKDDYNVVREELLDGIKFLNKYCDYIYIACQTLHGFLKSDEIKKYSLVSLLELIRKNLNEESREILIIASNTSANMNLHIPYLPNGKYLEQEKSSDAINNILKGKNVDLNWVEDLAEKQPVLLGCTEFSVALSDSKSPYIVDPIKLAAKDIVNKFLLN